MCKLFTPKNHRNKFLQSIKHKTLTHSLIHTNNTHTCNNNLHKHSFQHICFADSNFCINFSLFFCKHPIRAPLSCRLASLSKSLFLSGSKFTLWLRQLVRCVIKFQVKFILFNFVVSFISTTRRFISVAVFFPSSFLRWPEFCLILLFYILCFFYLNEAIHAHF